MNWLNQLLDRYLQWLDYDRGTEKILALFLIAIFLAIPITFCVFLGVVAYIVKISGG